MGDTGKLQERRAKGKRDLAEFGRGACQKLGNVKREKGVGEGTRPKFVSTKGSV